MDIIRFKFDAHQITLKGEDAAHEMTALNRPELGDADTDVTLDISLDLEVQTAARASSVVVERNATWALDTEDSAETALNLVLEYISMGDKAGASELLLMVLSSGDDAQREHAQSLLDSLE